MTRSQRSEFSDYEIEIEMSIRRKIDRYASDVLADVTHKETLTVKEADLLTVFDGLVNEATHKATKQTGIKRDAEHALLALEAGNDSYDAS